MGITLNTEKGILHCKHKQNWVVEEILIQKTHYQLLDAGALLQGWIYPGIRTSIPTMILKRLGFEVGKLFFHVFSFFGKIKKFKIFQG